MSDREGRSGVRRSVFAKLLAIMLTMALSLLFLVTGFFLLYVSPNLNAAVAALVREYARVISAAQPSYETAKGIASRLDVQIAYEGPRGTWATAGGLPTVEQVRRDGGSHTGSRYFVMPAPNGGAYLFAWTFTRRTQAAHLLVLALLLLLMAAVVFTAHAVLKRLLRPLRTLGDGVARLTDGDFDVELPDRSGDEFGALIAAFNRMTGRVRGMVQARDRLLLDVSHELRSPLTRLKVALELLPDTDRKARMAADLAEMEMMIGELIELERLRDGHGIPTAQQNVVPILEDVARNFDDRPPTVRVTSTKPEIIAEIDADRMRTVIRNLLENAVKYSLPDSRAVETSVAQNGEQIVIRVTDDGAGIPEGDIPSLFEPFFRVDRSRSKATGGYGLGLSISKRIMEAHGGTIAVQNNPARGASFIVTLPKPA